MYSLSLYFVVLFVFGATGTEFSKRCQDASPAVEFEEKLCASLIWHVYASNIPCENCHYRRNLTWLEPGLIDHTDTIISDRATVVHDFLAYKEKKNVYHFKIKNPTLAIVLDSYCRSEDRSYVVMYDPTENNFQVFTNNLDVEESFVNSLDGVKKCNMEYQRYIRK